MGTGAGVLRGGVISSMGAPGVGSPSKTMFEIRYPKWSLRRANWIQKGQQIRAKIDTQLKKWRL